MRNQNNLLARIIGIEQSSWPQKRSKREIVNSTLIEERGGGGAGGGAEENSKQRSRQTNRLACDHPFILLL